MQVGALIVVEAKQAVQASAAIWTNPGSGNNEQRYLRFRQGLRVLERDEGAQVVGRICTLVVLLEVSAQALAGIALLWRVQP